MNPQKNSISALREYCRVSFLLRTNSRPSTLNRWFFFVQWKWEMTYFTFCFKSRNKNLTISPLVCLWQFASNPNSPGLCGICICLPHSTSPRVCCWRSENHTSYSVHSEGKERHFKDIFFPDEGDDYMVENVPLSSAQWIWPDLLVVLYHGSLWSHTQLSLAFTSCFSFCL